MPRRMSCSMTIGAVRDRSKTVTRRHVDTWVDLVPGDRLTLIEKGMGLPKGARQVVLAEVEVVDVRVEMLAEMVDELGACRAEGFPSFTLGEFWRMWATSHGYPRSIDDSLPLRNIECRRIEWRYLDRVPT